MEVTGDKMEEITRISKGMETVIKERREGGREASKGKGKGESKGGRRGENEEERQPKGTIQDKTRGVCLCVCVCAFTVSQNRTVKA